MAVNLSVIGHYFFRRRAGWWSSLVSPAIGFGICLWIWLSVSRLAMQVGAMWSAAGIAYLIVLIRRRGPRLMGERDAAR